MQGIDESFRRKRVELDELDEGLRASALAGNPRAVGSDPRRAATVVLEGDRFHLELAPDWERKVGAIGITASVEAALSAALTARFERQDVSWNAPEVAEVTPPNSQVDASIVQRFVAENSAATESEFSIALDALVERARIAARERMLHRGPDALATVLLAPDGSVNQISFDEDAVRDRSAADLSADVMAALAAGQRSLAAPLLS